MRSCTKLESPHTRRCHLWSLPSVLLAWPAPALCFFHFRFWKLVLVAIHQHSTARLHLKQGAKPEAAGDQLSGFYLRLDLEGRRPRNPGMINQVPRRQILRLEDWEQ